MLKPYNRAELSFENIREIGHEGNNSKVFLVNDRQFNAQLVIKQIPKTSFSDRGEYFSEASILYLSSHPNVVPVHYACEDNDHVYLAMPHYIRGSLNALINTRYLTVREIIRYATQFLSGLHNIHAKRLIHFDVKPDNILISDQNEALLSDFGLAKPTTANGLAGQDRGYLKMLPPEAFTTDEFTTTFDIYQVGLTLYRMSVGNQEFYAQFDVYGDQRSFNRDKFRFDVRNERFPSRSAFPAHVPNRLRDVIKKCLSSNPQERFSSAISVVNVLSDIDGNDLDWQYEVSTDGSRTWTKSTDGRQRQLTIGVDGKSIATKTLSSGTMQKIKAFCLDRITLRDIQRFLKGN